MAKKKKQEQQERVVMTGLESLGLRVSSMINHPVAQQQRWVTIHRLDSDGDREWDEVMGLLSDTDGIEMTFNDDGTVTLKWEASTENDPAVQQHEELSVVEDEPAPF
ncbi:DUF1654 domain-containing protein [Pseudomonas sp. LF135]|uniref:DUF1654 domain-containing protein n=1 Tax=Pseudomonas azotoformans TaxID=47878 RepID=A0A4Q0HXZ4_PSEAZ|nr:MULTISPECIES: DUF1654 domain-containing protein [Pseudomonas]RXE54200.1 hypothetical protein B4O85_04980 [Pseudomonas azotoformans]SDT97953.1 Protein of unknown function [Pseudomonas yamanorum]